MLTAVPRRFYIPQWRHLRRNLHFRLRRSFKKLSDRLHNLLQRGAAKSAAQHLQSGAAQCRGLERNGAARAVPHLDIPHASPGMLQPLLRNRRQQALRGRSPQVVQHDVYLRLGELLQMQSPSSHSDVLNVLIVRAGNNDVGVAVDTIAERAETLMRPLTGLLQGMNGIAGTTLLGDGRVLLVLDVEELVQ